MYITVRAQEIKLQQKQNSLHSDPLVLTTNPERASNIISALGWAQHASVEISVDEFNTDYEVYSLTFWHWSFTFKF
jgi:hypothetical protein